MGKRNWLLLCRDESPTHACDCSLPTNVHVGHHHGLCIIVRISCVCVLETGF